MWRLQRRIALTTVNRGERLVDPRYADNPLMDFATVTDSTDRVITHWEGWLEKYPTRRRHYFEFYNNVVKHDPSCEQLSLSEIVEILAVYEPLRPWSHPRKTINTLKAADEKTPIRRATS